MIIDAHHHLWRRARGDYGWLTPDLGPLWRDFEADEAAALMAAHGVAGGILVQAAPTPAETGFLLGLAAVHRAILGVVGWADFADPHAPAAIERLAGDPALKGLRPMLQDLDDDDFILRPAADAALAVMARLGLRFEALARPRHLPRILEVRRRHPDLVIILDHAAKPDIVGGAWAPWAQDIAALAADGRTLCKLSGLITEAGPDWTVGRLRPYADHLLETFGPARLMWGSDWPVALLAGGYGQWQDAALALLDGLTGPERAAILGANAARAYGLSLD